MTGTVTPVLAQYLNKIIQPYINSAYVIRSSDELYLSQLQLQASHQLLSLDVESLFTSVRTGRRYYQHHLARSLQSPYSTPARYSTKSPTGTAQNLLIFNFNGNTFLQSDGVSMSSPLGPTLAHIYMSHLENKLLSQNNKKSNPIVYVKICGLYFDCF